MIRLPIESATFEVSAPPTMEQFQLYLYLLPQEITHFGRRHKRAGELGKQNEVRIRKVGNSLKS